VRTCVGVALVLGAVGCDGVLGVQPTVLADAKSAYRGPNNVVFVTSTVHVPGNLGGLANADMICAARANEAGLTGQYVALLATNNTLATDRLGNARGWVRPDGTPFADRVSDLLAGAIFYPPREDESGHDIAPTETAVVGASGFECGGWMDPTAGTVTGRPFYVGAAWANQDRPSCMQQQHLYCFGISLANPLVVTPTPGRRAFVTVQSFTPGGGLSAADATCASDAQLAGLNGTFVALMSTTSVSAVSRLVLNGPTWVRLDGVPLAATPLDFAAGRWLTALSVTSSVTYVDAGPYGASLSAPQPDGSYTCQDWTTTTGTGLVGRSVASDGEAIDTVKGPCSGAPLYCLES